MAGHSKWANIKHRKGAQDAKRGKIFTKLIKEITVASKEGGPELENNARLRLAVQNAKGKNMPKDTIERAIKKGQGSDATDYVEVTYEGYAPNGVAVIVECQTDNLNRTVSNVRAAFAKNNGSLGKNGSVDFMFERKGSFSFPFPEGSDEDEFMLELIDGGAEDVEIEDGRVNVTTALEDFGTFQSKLEELNIEAENAELDRIPATTVSVDDDSLVKIMKLIDRLEDDDDIQKVFHNMDISDEQIALLE
ncbi:YebC/PmpR family DNA-binding transcriptional regulator [Flammeovirgaceae bacterium SG7u.111]|nr:YebC/PmpR family DNA-binding transcriptional regulator [Flammeovirgaceae bacterium SG7u.132]WPO38211.1 YebC/PmpR family DNA-binding transcriptional regulator [Flammeovirgaceae bacterium SG7u.111]